MTLHHRRSIRLKGYDYSQSGAYFITICAHNRLPVFGKVINGKMILNNYGKIADVEWRKTAEIRKNVIIDEYIIMPNHIHGIIVIDNENRRGVLQYAPTLGNIKKMQNATTFQSPSQTIGAIIRGCKSSITRQINILRNMPGNPVWQSNYYEHIIRNENAMNRIRQYIINNPVHWTNDSNSIFGKFEEEITIVERDEAEK